MNLSQNVLNKVRLNNSVTVCEQADEKTLMVVFRIDSSDGVPPFCVARHRPKNYHSVFSSDAGYTWTAPTAMHDITGRGMGTAFPSLLMLGDSFRVVSSDAV